jgi:hypothetical protein
MNHKRQRHIEQPAGRLHRRGLVAALVGLTLTACSHRWADAQEVEVLLPAKEAQVKCAFLYSFSLMIEWPGHAFADAKAPVVIGVLGDRPHLMYLDRVAKKEVRGRPLAIERYPGVAQIGDCHILFITGSVSLQDEAAAIAKLGQSHTLVVGERPLDATAAATHIHFVIENQGVKFHLDHAAVKQRQLTVDPRLIKLARLRPAATPP